MTTQTLFAVGDRVRVAAATAHKHYIGAEGVVVRDHREYTNVQVSAEERFRINGHTGGTEWSFYKHTFTLELVGPAEPEPYEAWFR